jgi:prepilin-type N-terminal cleavage/methylation domain-containing protein
MEAQERTHANPRSSAAVQGFSLLELVIVLAIVAAVCAFAIPSIGRRRAVEIAKADTNVVANALRQARMRAMKDGIQYIVVFNPAGAVIAPPIPPAAQGTTLARVVRDDNGDGVESVGDTLAINVVVEPDPYGVRPYNPVTDPYNLANEPDQVAAPFSTLGNALGGATFARPGVGTTAIAAFNSRGIPIIFNQPTSFAQGLGGYYITDGRGSVFGARLGPLGEVRVRSLNVAQIGQVNPWQ